MLRAAAVLCVICAGCLDSGVVHCADGAICGEGLTCDDRFGGCVSRTPCLGHADGDACRAAGVPVGTCTDQQCVPRACGDMMTEGAETCDDGNYASHDGCDSTCVLEVPTWTEKDPAAAPPARAFHAMAYDSDRQRTVLFGGIDSTNMTLSDTWEWDGVTWSRKTPATSPGRRGAHSMAYDAARRRTVLFGGTIDDTGMTTVADTWEWDGSNWIDRTPAISPAPRMSVALAYDARRQRVVLFGGLDANNVVGETWEWDGTTWTKRSPALSPTPRGLASFTYDAAREHCVLFGGQDDSQVYSDETWTWDGDVWSQLTPSQRPTARAGGAMAYDTATRHIVLYGGGLPGASINDLWEWDGAAWNERVIGLPSDRVVSALVSHDARRELVLFGGFATTAFKGDTWTYRYASGSPDETCVEGVDADGDGFSACEDPDCVCTP